MLGAIFSGGVFCCAAGAVLSAGFTTCADANPVVSSKPAATVDKRVDKRYARFIFVSSGNPTKLKTVGMG
jgi:hypothetical protein